MGKLSEHLVISLGCEYGCGGSAVGRKIAEKLGIAYYDRQIVDKIMEQVGVSPSLISLANKGIDVSGLRAEEGYAYAPTKYMNLTDRMVYLQKEVIKKLADKSSCLIVGRCSDYILRERNDCINIFIYAPQNVRLKNVAEELKVDEKKALKLIQENDENLHARYLQITGTDWGERHNRQLLIDSSMLGVEGTADYLIQFILEFYKKVYPKKAEEISAF